LGWPLAVLRGKQGVPQAARMTHIRAIPPRATGSPQAPGALRVALATAMLVGAGCELQTAAAAFEARGIQFIPLPGLRAFQATPGQRPGETVLTSRPLVARIPWNELIVSWNADLPADSYLKVEARALYPEGPTKFFVLGRWSSNPARYPRESVNQQQDADGDVRTDTLVLNRLCERLQLRLTLGGDAPQAPTVRFLGLCLLDNTAQNAPLPPRRAAWGCTVPVPERSQMAYAGGGAWCSPTTVSMMLAFWAARLKRPELDRDVPEIVRGTYDAQWEGTGNWVFNTAYAGALPGLRAYVVRLSDVAELEQWVAHGMPVGLSLCYNRLRGTSRQPSGHLVVCVGFTSTGDPVLNDPGTREQVRKVFPRANLVDAWAYSKNAAYLIYPERTRVPPDRYGHWDSATARRRVQFAP